METLTREAAEILTTRIRNYWAGKVRCRVEYIHGEPNGHSRHFCVRSDMVNGMPRNPLGEDWQEDISSIGKIRRAA